MTYGDGSEVIFIAHRLITGDRQADYGHPADDYTKVAEIFRGLTGIEMSVQQALCFPLAMKLARMRTNRENLLWHEDSVVDAIGYLGCMAMAERRGYR
jgi:hypothetical protein